LCKLKIKLESVGYAGKSFVVLKFSFNHKHHEILLYVLKTRKEILNKISYLFSQNKYSYLCNIPSQVFFFKFQLENMTKIPIKQMTEEDLICWWLVWGWFNMVDWQQISQVPKHS